MVDFSREHSLDGLGVDVQSVTIDSFGSTSFVLYVLVPGSWDRAATVTVDVSPDGVVWSPGVAGGTASPASQAVVATDDGKLFFIAFTGAHRYLRINYDNTTAGTTGTLKMKLICGQPRSAGWVATSG